MAKMSIVPLTPERMTLCVVSVHKYQFQNVYHNRAKSFWEIYAHFICHFRILFMSNKWYFKRAFLRIRKVKRIIYKIVLSHSEFHGN